MRILTILALLIGMTLAGHGLANEVRQATLYKNPQCDCCHKYAGYLRLHGIRVKEVNTHDLAQIKREHGVPAQLNGCHTMLTDGYVVEGHVPVKTVRHLLAERPDIKGISLPGMPQGSPGMTGRKAESFTIYEISDGMPKVFAVE